MPDTAALYNVATGARVWFYAENGLLQAFYPATGSGE